MSDETKSKGGRPSKLTDEMPDQVKLLAEKGWTDAEIAKFYKVTEQTVNNWKKVNSEFFESLKLGKKEADEKVKRSLFERATGYSHPDTHISNFQGQITVTEVTKHYPPDTTACIFWLKNREPADWRDRQEIDHGVTEEMAEILKRIRSRE